MILKVWRLSENSGDNNLGLACTEQGLVLGRTALIERRNGRFVVRERSEIEQLLSRTYQLNVVADRFMPGLATVAAALNANDQALARIAAVHLRIPDLPNQAARDAMEAADVLIKSADWNPALHPRAGTMLLPTPILARMHRSGSGRPAPHFWQAACRRSLLARPQRRSRPRRRGPMAGPGEDNISINCSVTDRYPRCFEPSTTLRTVSRPASNLSTSMPPLIKMPHA